MLTGGCHCGAVRYEATGEFGNAALCHCTDCRRTTGAPAVAWFTLPTEAFRFTKGEPARYASSAKAERTFCARCGAQITFVHEDYDGKRLDITTASLDDPQVAPPRLHIFTRIRLAWMNNLNALPDRSMDEQP
jgi:hypothetical protein